MTGSECTDGIDNTILLFLQLGHSTDPFPTVTKISHAFQLVWAEKGGWKKVP